MQVAQVMELVPNQRFLMSLKTRQLGDSDDDINDDDSDEVTKNDDDGDNEASDKYEELYKDVTVRLKATENKEEGKGDAEMTDVGRDDGTQHITYDSSISSDFANQFLNLDNVPTTDSEVLSMMNVKVRHEEPSTQTPSLLNIPIIVIPKTLTAATPIIPLTIPPITPLTQQSTPTPTPAPTTAITTTLIPALLDFSSLLKDSIQKTFISYTAEVEKKAKDERKKYIDLVEKSMKDIIKDEVKTQLPQILPKEVSEFATPVIQSTLTESLKNAILLDKIQKSKSYRVTQEHRDLYDALVKSYKLDKDLYESYGKSYSLKRVHEDKDKDEDPPAGSDQWLKQRKTSKDAEPSKGFKLKESKSSLSKGTKYQSKSSGKSTQAEESVFEIADTDMPQNQGGDLGNTDDQPNVEETSRDDWFKKPKRPPTPDPD
ncbi:hypothetical protein Tco_1080510 [Tanacetum coccineum]|uniref:Uncharacterized protein n=1 Tax=Tanacetum coccineum TaxID=301880 RepID=A0ABQ5HWG4_9ASTR